MVIFIILFAVKIFAILLTSTLLLDKCTTYISEYTSSIALNLYKKKSENLPKYSLSAKRIKVIISHTHCEKVVGHRCSRIILTNFILIYLVPSIIYN